MNVFKGLTTLCAFLKHLLGVEKVHARRERMGQLCDWLWLTSNPFQTSLGDVRSSITSTLDPVDKELIHHFWGSPHIFLKTGQIRGIFKT